MINFIKRINWDLMGMITSIACAIHCAILPLILTSLPLFGINIINNSLFEWTMIGIAFVVGCYALSHGYRRLCSRSVLLPELGRNSGASASAC